MFPHRNSDNLHHKLLGDFDDHLLLTAYYIKITRSYTAGRYYERKDFSNR